MAVESFEEQWGFLGRRLGRLRRWLGWRGKGLAGLPRTLLVETRWRLGDEVMMLPVVTALAGQMGPGEFWVWSNYPDLYEGQPGIAGLGQPDRHPDGYLLLRGASRTAPRPAYLARKAGLSNTPGRPRLRFRDWTPPPHAGLDALARPLVAMAPGTTWPAKHWPPTRWQTLARLCRDAGMGVAELGQGHAPLGLGRPLVDATTVREAACVLHAADAVVSCDSGLMHLALAAGTPAVALFGPTDPDILIQDEPLFHPLRSGLPCQGRWNRPGPEPSMESCPEGHESCLEDIAPEAVYRRLCQLLEQGGAGRGKGCVPCASSS